jgi:hypothetical protein
VQFKILEMQSFKRTSVVGRIQMKLSLYLTLIVAIVMAGGCGHKPSYSQMETDQSGKASNQNAVASSAAEKPVPLPDPSAQPLEITPQDPRNQQAGVPPPSFFDSKSGQIKDLPSYPRARRVRLGFGPMSGFETMILQLTTRDPIDKVVAFYDQAIKSNGWSVVENSRDTNNYQWTLLKQSGQGVIQIALQTQGRPVVYVSLQRAKSLEASK